MELSLYVSVMHFKETLTSLPRLLGTVVRSS